VGSAEVEQSEDLVLGQADAARGGTGFGEDGVEQFAFFLQDLIDPFFDGADRQHAGDGDRAGDADAVSAVDGLVFDGRIPPAVEQEDVPAELQVQAPRCPRRSSSRSRVWTGRS
jgi:hypothetical protein